ncbi:MAG: cation:proton antiporter [Candidatus Nanohalobium sp.]
MSEVIYLLAAVFAAASMLVLLMEELSHPYIPAYIGAGILTGLFVDASAFYTAAEIGVAFLVFIFGVKLEPDRLRSVASESQLMTTLQIASVGLLSLPVMLLVGVTVVEAIYLSIAVSLSSSLIGMQLLHKEIDIDLLHGRLAESSQLLQDVIAIIAVVALNSVHTSSNTVLTHVFLSLVVLGTGLLTRKYIYKFVADFIEEERELMVITSLGFLTAFVAAAEALNLSIVVGAFAAGMAISRFPYNVEVIDVMEPLKEFFILLFFVSVGALISIPSFKALLIAGVLLFFSQVVKPLVSVVALAKQGLNLRTAHLTGFNIDQISEFSLVIGLEAFLAGTIGFEAFHGLILAASTSFLISSYTSRHGELLYQKMNALDIWHPGKGRDEDSSHVEEGLENHVILIGFDTQGKIIAEALQEEGADFVVIENNPENLMEASEQVENYIFDDVMNESAWRKARAEKASLVISTVPFNKVTERLLQKDLKADLIVRCTTIEEASRFVDECLYVEVPELLVSEQLADHINGVLKDERYREELRRKNLLEIRELLSEQE